MVRDAYYYALPLAGAAALVGWLAGALWGVPIVFVAGFFVWFFRDPDRSIPPTAGAVVAPADGKVTDIGAVMRDGERRTRISIFLSVFDVHVNRSPVAGTICDVRYQCGKFLNAMKPSCADQNEQNIVTIATEGQTVIFKQIAGLLARRIVFNKKVGDHVERGERVGLIKFGSRVDVLLDVSAALQVKIGERVKGGASVLAYLRTESPAMAAATAGSTHQGAV
jgi:phosphatidylserine decarboxylase